MGVMIPAVLPTATENMSAFIENVVRFPLGLAGIRSPAASPLLGHVVVSVFPGIHRVFTVAVAGAGSLVLGYVLVKRRPKTPAQLSRLVGWVMTVAILLAPATRVGYLLYPVDFFVWAWLLARRGHRRPRTGLRRRPQPGPGRRRGLGRPEARRRRPRRPDGRSSGTVLSERDTVGDGGSDRSPCSPPRGAAGSGLIRHRVQP